MIDQAVVLGVEHTVDGREGNVFVAAAVAGDVVKIEQLVVIGAGGLEGGCRAHGGVGIGHFAAAGVGVVGDIVEEGMAGAERINRAHWR